MLSSAAAPPLRASPGLLDALLRMDPPAEVVNGTIFAAGPEADESIVWDLVDGLEGFTKSWTAGYDARRLAYMWEVIHLLTAGGHPGDYLVILKEMAATHESPRCGEVWTGPHVAYRCLTCGLSDSSCMCVTCFDPEDHVGHEFRLYSSGAGGCCDCGDSQAWRESGFCVRHRRSPEDEAQMYSLDFPNHRVERGASLATRAVLCHSVWALRRAFFQTGAPDPAGVFALKRVVAYIGEMTNSCPGLRLLMGRALFAKLPTSMLLGTFQVTGLDLVADSCALQALLRLGNHLPDPLPDQLGAHLLHLLLDAEFKKRFTLLFVTVYPTFVGYFVADAKCLADQDRADCAEYAAQEREDSRFGDQAPPQAVYPRHRMPLSILARNMSRFLDRIFCQLFHSEAVVLEALGNFDILAPMMQGVSSMIVPVDLGAPRIKDGKYNRLFSDVTLILNHHPVVAKAAAQRNDLWAHALTVLEAMQGMDSQRRISDGMPHVLFESRAFHAAYGLSSDVASLLWPLLAAQSEGGEAWVRDRLRETEEAITRSLQKRDEREEEGLLAVGQGPLSMHYPLVRMWAAQVSVHQSALWFGDSRVLLRAAQLSASVLVFCEQIMNGQWVRNGLTLRQQVQWNLSRFWSFDNLDRDITVLQAAIVVCGGTPVFSMLARMGGEDWALRIMCIACCDRMGCGSLDAEAKARRSILQALAIKDMPFSETEKHVMQKHRGGADVQVEGILAALASFRPGGPDGGSAMYSLKPECWRDVWFGGVYARWTPEEEEKALGNWRKANKRGEDDVPAPPALTAPSDLFAPLVRNVLESLHDVCIYMLHGSEECTAAINLCYWGIQTGIWQRSDLQSVLEGAVQRHQGPTASRLRTCLSLLGVTKAVAAAAGVATAGTAGKSDGASEKKRAGLAQQQRIMRQYQQRQSAFLEADEDGDDSDTGTGEGGRDADAPTCAFCSEDGSSSPLALISCVQESATLAAEQTLLFESANVAALEPVGYLSEYAPHACLARLREGHGDLDLVLHSCGHHAHQKCALAYLATARMPDPHVHADDHEMLCPLCRRFTNVLMPIAVWGDDAAAASRAREFWEILDVTCDPCDALASQLSIWYIARRGGGWAESHTFEVALRNMIGLVIASGPGEDEEPSSDRVSLSMDMLTVLCRQLRAARPQSRAECAAVVLRLAASLLPLARLQDAVYDALEEPLLSRTPKQEDWKNACLEALNLANEYGGLQGMENALFKRAREESTWLSGDISSSSSMSTKFEACVSQGKRLLALPNRASAHKVLEARIRLLLRALDAPDAAGFEETLEGVPPHARLVDEWMALLVAGGEGSRVNSLAAKLASSALAQPRLFSTCQRAGRLVSCPKDFATLMLRFVARPLACDECHAPPANPALCLLCGRLLCAQSMCCSVDGVDEMFAHETSCPRSCKGMGAVLLLKNSSLVLLMLGKARVCVYGSLFLDEHGEEDVTLNRGRPLFCDPQRFDRLDRDIAAASLLTETKVFAKMARPMAPAPGPF